MATRLLAANIMVRDLKTAAERYSRILGAEPHWIYYADNPGFSECAFYPGDSKFCLLHSTSDDVYGQFLREKGEGIVAIWFQVDDLNREAERLRSLGVEFMTDEPVVFSEGKYLVAGASSMYGVITGFVEARSDLPWGKTLVVPQGFSSPVWSAGPRP